MSADEVLAVWRSYRETKDHATRDRLVLTFAPLVKYIVYRKVRELPAHCEVDDLISCGLEALIHSIERFDPDRGATLEQFAWTRIHGAVIDELRRLDWAPRSVRRWERDIARARDEFVRLHGRRASRDELAAALGTTTEDLRRREDDIVTSEVTSLNALVMGEEESAVERLDTITGDDVHTDPEWSAEADDAKIRFRAAFERLPQRQRQIAILLYVEELTLREIGEILGVSESRVCQIHGELKRALRNELSADEALFAAVA